MTDHAAKEQGLAISVRWRTTRAEGTYNHFHRERELMASTYEEVETIRNMHGEIVTAIRYRRLYH